MSSPDSKDEIIDDAVVALIALALSKKYRTIKTNI
jgi:hypothetical protein